MADAEADPIVHVSASRAREWTVSVLEAAGVPTSDAAIVAASLVLADLRGVESHGVNRIPLYLAQIAGGSLLVAADPEQQQQLPPPSGERPSGEGGPPGKRLDVEQRTPVMARIDARGGFGFVAATRATEHCMRVAETFGVGVAAVTNSSHLGMAATYVLQACERGFAAMVFSNAPPAMPPYGSREKLWGTNPLAVGFPGRDEDHFVLDMSPCVAARGKIIKAARRGESIPPGWMIDAAGNPTTDPRDTFAGSVLPIGGAKGAGLAAMVDIFSGLLTGGAFAGSVSNGILDPSKPSGTGHWIMVFRPEVFLDSKEEYFERMDELTRSIRNCEPAPGFDAVRTPGENSRRIYKERSRTGIPLPRNDIDLLHESARKVGCEATLVD